jgi:hypothetical protein
VSNIENNSVGILKGMATKKSNEQPKKVGIFGDNYKPQVQQPVKSVEKKKSEEVEIKKMTLHLADELHKLLKDFSAKRGQPMQHILNSLINEFLKKENKPELNNPYALYEGNTIKTTFDMDPKDHKKLVDFKKEHKYKMRFVFEVLINEFLVEMGEK